MLKKLHNPPCFAVKLNPQINPGLAFMVVCGTEFSCVLDFNSVLVGHLTLSLRYWSRFKEPDPEECEKGSVKKD